MRIAVITNAFPPQARGGAGVIAAELAEGWRRMGHEVRVWCQYAPWLQRNVVRRLWGHIWDDRKPFGALGEVVDWKPEIIVTHNLTGCGWRSGRSARTLTGAAWIHVLHDVQMFEPSGRIAHDRISWWQCAWGWYRERLLGVPTVVVSPSAWLLEAHRRRGCLRGAKECIVPNPAPDIQIERSNAAEGWVYAAQEISAAKGADLIGELARHCPHEAFHVIGRGALPEAWNVLPNIRHHGVCTRDEVLRRMAAAKGVLVPSRIAENQPTVILEALQLGVPVIGSPVGGIPETIQDGGMIAPLTVSAWKRALEDITRDLATWNQRARQAGQRYNVQSVLHQWEMLFSEFGIKNS